MIVSVSKILAANRLAASLLASTWDCLVDARILAAKVFAAKFLELKGIRLDRP